MVALGVLTVVEASKVLRYAILGALVLVLIGESFYSRRRSRTPPTREEEV
jgi:hypothetical protein